MARVTFTAQPIVVAGLLGVYSQPTTGSGNGMTIASDPSHRTLIHILSPSNTCTATFLTPGTNDGLAIAERTVTCTSQNKFVPLRRNYLQSDGFYYVEFDANTGVTVGAFKVTAE